MTQIQERRFITRDTTVENRVVQGYGAVTDVLTDVAGLFLEKLKPGCFARCIRERQDIRLLVNHNGLPLARTVNGSLTLNEDSHGLRFRATIAATQVGDDLLRCIGDGLVSGCSFAFVPRAEDIGYCADPVDGSRRVLRTVTDMDVHDVSIVTYPQYPETSVEVVPAAKALAMAATRSAQFPEGLPLNLSRLIGPVSAMSDEERYLYTQALQLL